MGAGEGEIVVATEKLRKVYGDGRAERAALDGVTLAIRRGELVCVLGPSGSGKSTLLAVLGALDRAYEGKVELFGRDLASAEELELAELRGRRIGFVFQAFHLLAHLTVLENVLVPSLFCRDGDALAPRALALLDRLGLADRAHDPPARLSGGQRQRVAIARALLRGPELVLCDEPTGNLDAETGAETIALFRELHREQGLTLVVVTHEERLAAIATRTIELRQGRIASGTGAPAEAAAP